MFYWNRKLTLVSLRIQSRHCNSFHDTHDHKRTAKSTTCLLDIMLSPKIWSMRENICSSIPIVMLFININKIPTMLNLSKFLFYYIWIIRFILLKPSFFTTPSYLLMLFSKTASPRFCLTFWWPFFVQTVCCFLMEKVLSVYFVFGISIFTL